MARLLMTACVLVALVLPRFPHGRAATDNSGSILSTLMVRTWKSEDLSENKQRTILSLVQGDVPIPTKVRERRLSDQRRAELETLVTLSNISDKLTAVSQGHRQLDPARIGRRRRSTVVEAILPGLLLSIDHRTAKLKRNGDPAYPLIS